MSVFKEKAPAASGLESRRALFTGGELDVRFPFLVNLPGSTHRLAVRTDLLGDFVRRSPVFPLRTIAFLEPEHPTAADGGSPRSRRVVRYSSRRGGNLKVYLGSIWQVAEDYIQGNLINRLGPLKVSTEWQNWTSAVKTRIKDYPRISTALDYQEDKAEVARLWQWLTTDILINYAALTHLSLDAALFKKLVVDNRLVALNASLIAIGGLVGLSKLYPGLATGILLGDLWADRMVSNKLEKKIEGIKDQMFYYTSQVGPLVRLV